MLITVISQVLYPSRIVIVPTPHQTLKLADKWCNGIITWEGLIRMWAPHARGTPHKTLHKKIFFL